MNYLATASSRFVKNFRETSFITALILVPTRELAIQVSDHLKRAGQHITKGIISIVGGMSEQKQERLLSKTPDILVATPGRLWSMLNDVHIVLIIFRTRN